jgi:hypothetical protein
MKKSNVLYLKIFIIALVSPLLTRIALKYLINIVDIQTVLSASITTNLIFILLSIFVRPALTAKKNKDNNNVEYNQNK